MLGGGGTGAAFGQGQAGAGRVGGRVFWVGAGRAEGGGRGGTLISPGYGPIRCGRFGVKNARVVKKFGEKETPLGEKETPLGEKVAKVGEKVNFVGEKKIHRDEAAVAEAEAAAGAPPTS